MNPFENVKKLLFLMKEWRLRLRGLRMGIDILFLFEIMEYMEIKINFVT